LEKSTLLMKTMLFGALWTQGRVFARRLPREILSHGRSSTTPAATSQRTWTGCRRSHQHRLRAILHADVDIAGTVLTGVLDRLGVSIDQESPQLRKAYRNAGKRPLFQALALCSKSG